MSRFVKTDVTPAIDLGKGDSVILRKRLGYRERGKVEERLLKIETDEAGNIKTAGLSRTDANLELLMHAIVSWSGPGFCALVDHDDGGTHEGPCQPMEKTEAVLCGMDETAERILNELEKVLVIRTPDFITAPSRGSTTGTEAPTRPTGSLT